MSFYQRLGVTPVINAQGRYTLLGGAVLPEPVIEAMAEAARSFVDLFDLHRAAGERLAELTRNEAAYVCNGASAGLFLTALGCMTGCDERALRRLPSLASLKDEIVIHRLHRMPLDPALELSGARLVEIGNILKTDPEDLDAAITERTAAVFYMAGTFFAQGTLSLAQTIEIAHARGVPVVVDAAEQLPPASNFWHYTRDLGADLAIFSGGKNLCGPQASGLIVGRPDLVRAAFLNGAPHVRLGRPMKVGKEEIAGLIAAVERFLSLDHEALNDRREELATTWEQQLAGLDDAIVVEALYPSWSKDWRRVLIDVRSAEAGFTGQDLRRRLLEQDPAVAVEIPPNSDSIYLNPETIEEGEAEVVVAQIRRAVSALRAGH